MHVTGCIETKQSSLCNAANTTANTVDGLFCSLQGHFPFGTASCILYYSNSTHHAPPNHQPKSEMFNAITDNRIQPLFPSQK